MVPGLYPLQDTGLSTAHLKDACDGFLETLQPKMRAAAMFPVGADEWRTWINANEWANRHGAFLRDMDQRAREAFEDLLCASLSDTGFSLIRDAMRLSEYLGESLRIPKSLTDGRTGSACSGGPRWRTPGAGS